jgi:pimeloyl-ACP methyl ester carboxylesterase
MTFRLVREEGFEYIEEGTATDRPVLLLLHGLFGALSNWADVLQTFSRDYTVLIPLLPIYKSAVVEANLEALTEYVHTFVEHKRLDQFVVIGNSLGGHLALLYTLKHPERVHSLVLTGSSGLFEAGMGLGFVKRGDYTFIRERVEFTFYKPSTATKELVDEVFDIVNNRMAAMRILNIARNAQRMNLHDQLRTIQHRTCLVWGLNDNITPPYVAHEFRRLMPNSELHFIDQCGHAAMMERPDRFNVVLSEFLARQLLLQKSVA